MTTKYKLDRETLELLTNASQMLSYFGRTYKMIPITKLKAFDKDQIIGQDMEFTSWLNDLAEIGNKLLEASPAQESEPVAYAVWNLVDDEAIQIYWDKPEQELKAKFELRPLYAHPPADKDVERWRFFRDLKAKEKAEF